MSNESPSPALSPGHRLWELEQRVRQLPTEGFLSGPYVLVNDVITLIQEAALSPGAAQQEKAGQ